MGRKRFQRPDKNRYHIRKEPDLVFIPTYLDYFCTGRKGSYATVCNNCDTGIQYVYEHYFHYDAKMPTDALSTDQGQLKGATGSEIYIFKILRFKVMPEEQISGSHESLRNRIVHLHANYHR